MMQRGAVMDDDLHRPHGETETFLTACGVALVFIITVVALVARCAYNFS